MISSNNSVGFFLIDKPAGISSFDVIRQLRKHTNIKRIGHAGTLDPFATGLLIVAIGKATRLLDYLLTKEKTYYAKMRIGIQTDTGDPTGKIIAKDDSEDMTMEAWQALVPTLMQMKEQKPPAYSAIKINGVRAYDVARSGKEVDLPARKMEITDFTILDYQYPWLEYQTRVSKGTYIRVLSETFASLAGLPAFTYQLRRLSIGDLSIEAAVPLEMVSDLNWKDHLHDIVELFPDHLILQVSTNEVERVLHGASIPCESIDNAKSVFIQYDGHCLAIADIENHVIFPKVVLQ